MVLINVFNRKIKPLQIIRNRQFFFLHLSLGLIKLSQEFVLCINLLCINIFRFRVKIISFQSAPPVDWNEVWCTGGVNSRCSTLPQGFLSFCCLYFLQSHCEIDSLFLSAFRSPMFSRKTSEFSLPCLERPSPCSIY